MSRVPLVSVVTPSFNQAQFLEETMRSVLDQDYPRIEYIVVDGGSTDGSVDVIRRYADRLAYWVSENDRGQADAINKGWSRVTGDIVAFLNSDDYYLPGAISRVVEAFREHPAAGLVSGQGAWVSESGEWIQRTRWQIGEDERYEPFNLYRVTALPQPAAFVRRRVIEEVGMLDPSFHFGLDGEFFLRVLGNFPALSLPETIACMRLHRDAKSVASGVGFAPDILRIARKIVENPERYPRFDVVPDEIMAAAHILSARSCYMGGAFGAAVGRLAESARVSGAFRSLIIRREFPRLLGRMLLGKRRYLQLSGFLNR
jgi:glycosyltransferase involved in cell wall biosynthesis